MTHDWNLGDSNYTGVYRNIHVREWSHWWLYVRPGSDWLINKLSHKIVIYNTINANTIFSYQ